MVTSEIKVTSLLPSTLDTREGASRLAEIVKEDLLDNSQVELDFQDVLFMSRSFADQFHKELMTGDHSVNVIIKNAEVGIIEMLEAVSRTQNNRKKIEKSYQIISFNNFNKLQDYSYAW